MKQFPLCRLALLALALTLDTYAQTAPATAELTALLKQFLEGASRNDATIHDRFWAEDLIYTRSAGRRVSKTDVMRDVRAAPAPKPGDPTTTYTAEDIRIQQYGDTAIVAFRLVGTIDRGGKIETTNHLNTGTFLKRDSKWQVVAWQATRMPASEEASRKDVAETEAAFQQASLAGDIRKLETLLDESFVWTLTTGEQKTRAQFLDQLKTGRLKYSKIETNSITVSIYGDAAVVRGVSQQQRSAFPGAEGSGDARPFVAFYTLTFINRGGSWRAVAMHTSQM